MKGKKESEFQKEIIEKIKSMFPECMVFKNDANYIQGIPDWTILWKNKWAILEMKKSINSPYRPNQKVYLEKLDKMMFAKMICPENKEEVLNELYTAFRS